MMQLLIIGGSDAGISAALRAKELDPTVKHLGGIKNDTRAIVS